MAVYSSISDTQLDPDAPLTSQLMYQLRDNPLAVFQGVPSAPRIQDNIVGGIGTTVFSSLNSYGGVFIWGTCIGYNNSIPAGPENTNVVVKASADGSTYFSGSTIVNVNADDYTSFSSFIDFATGSYVSTYFQGTEAKLNTGILEGSLGLVSLKFTATNASYILRPQGGLNAS